MAYEVTAARRRPQRFEDLVGQDFVAATLINAIADGKIAHAYLFSGPRGCGKTSAARILARVLNCIEGAKKAPCGVCGACTEIARGASMDVIEIDGASNTSVNDVRQIKDEILFPPNSFKYKIYIIDEVHMLSTSAFNALLKTIEEPPPYVIFIFATTELHKVPATIKSRCQQFHFRLGSVDQIKDLLAEAAKEVGIEAANEALYWIAREATGSFRDAYTLFDQIAAFSEGTITYEKIRDKLGLVGVERLNELCVLCVGAKTAEAVQFLDDVLQGGVSIEQFISNIGDYMRSLLFIKNGITKESLLGQASDRFSAEVIAAWSSVQLERALSIFLQLFRDVRYSLNPRYELELAIARLCWLSSWVSNSEVKIAIDKAKILLTDGSVPTGAGSVPVGAQRRVTGEESVPHDVIERTTEIPPHAFESVQTSDPSIPMGMQEGDSSEGEGVSMGNPSLTIEKLKIQAVDLIEKTKVLVASALNQSQAWTCEESTIHIAVETPFLQRQLEAESPYISTVLTNLWGKPVQLAVELVEIESSTETEEIPANVQMVVDVFKGEITSVENSKASETRNFNNVDSNNGEENEHQSF